MVNLSQFSRALCCIAFTIAAVFSLSLDAATPQLQEKLGVKNLDIIKNAKFVTILTMVPDRAKNRIGAIKEMHLNNDEIERLKTNLLDDHNYDFDRVKKCHFNPEVSFKFQGEKEQDVVHAFVSPSCNQILFGMEAYSVLLNYDPAHERIENFVLQLVNETRTRNKDTANRY